MSETAYNPDPRPQPLTFPPSRQFVGTVSDSLFIDRQSADTVGASIETTKRGTIAGDTNPLLLNNGVFQIRAKGWNGVANVDAGRLQINAAENFTGSANAAYLRFQGPLLGAVTQQELFRVQPTASAAELWINGTAVVGARNTGWTAMTGTTTKGGFDTTTVTTAQLAQVVKALQEALTTHGLIGA